jgi:transposase-like protein
MDQSKNKTGRTMRTNEEIYEAITEFEQGGISIPEFCELYGISNSTFYEWQKKYKMRNQEGNNNMQPIIITDDVLGQTERLPIAELELSDGRLFRIFKEANPDFLKAFIS